MKSTRLLFVPTFLVVVACASAAPDSTETNVDTTTRKGSSSSSGFTANGEESSSSSSSGAATSSGASSSSGAAARCTDYAGFWSGPVDGTYIDASNPSNVQKVDGTATVKLVAGSGGFTLDKDSAINIVIHNLPPIDQDVSVKKSLGGTATCAKLDAKSNGDTGIIKIDVTAACTFASAKCTGQWSANSGTKPIASGTFSLTKKL